MAAFLAVFPDLFDRHLLLIDLVDDRTRILHFRKSGLFHAAGIAVVENGEVEDILIRLRVDAPAGVLRPGPVKVAFALRTFALNGLAVLVDGLKHLVSELRTPAFGRTHDPLHLLVAADLNERGLMTGADDDGVVGRVVVDGVDVRPVAACAGTDDVAEVVGLIEFGKLFGSNRLTGLRRINVEAYCALVERFQYIVAVGIKDVPERPFVNHRAVLIHFDDHVANRADMLAVGTSMVGRGNAHEVIAVLHRIHGVREVGIAVGQLTVEDFTSHQIVLDVALAVAPGERAVIVLTEAHHDAGHIDIVRVVDLRGFHVPADLTLRVVDGVLRITVPFECAAHRVVPDRAGRVRRCRDHVVDEVEAVAERRINLFDFSHRED